MKTKLYKIIVIAILAVSSCAPLSRTLVKEQKVEEKKDTTVNRTDHIWRNDYSKPIPKH